MKSPPLNNSWRPQTCRVFVISTILLFLLTCTAYVHFDAWYHDSLINVLRKKKETLMASIWPNFEKPIILLWTPYFSVKDYLPKLEDRCEVDCFITSDRKYLPLSSAVVFHARDVNSDIPKSTPSNHQAWVLYNNESPKHSPTHVFKLLEGRINWTVTYRTDSTIQSPYGKIRRRESPLPSLPAIETKKTALVCWIVSNCNTDSQREVYVKELKSFVPVEVYGGCGSQRCPTDNSRSCYHHISKRCKFYLSFENSLCKDYATEKLFNALRTDMVPVVMGGANYSQLAPPNSCINALDYGNSQELAKYLLQLDANDTKYMQYHEWKRNYEFTEIDYLWSCQLCHRLYNMSNYVVEAHENLNRWWFGPGTCFSLKELLKLKSYSRKK